MKSLVKKNYHWIMALVVLLELAVYTGILNNFSNLFLVPITETLGVPRASFGLSMSLKYGVSFLITVVSGAVVLRFGYRKLVIASLLSAASAYIIYANVQNMGMLYLAAAILGLSDPFCSTVSASRIVSTWFHRYQGLILGIVTAATGVGGSILCVFMSGSIENHGWKTAMMSIAILVAVTAVVMFLTVRNRPDDMGLRPYGYGSSTQAKQRKRQNDHWLGYTSQEIYRKPTFYLMILSTLLACICAYCSFNVLVPHLQDCGLTASEAASMQSIMLLGLTLSKVVCGSLCDVIGSKAVTLLCLICSTVSLYLLTIVDSYLSATVAVIVFAFALPLTSVTVPLLGSALFGYRTQNTTSGVFLAMVPAASMIITPIANASYDRLGSYNPIFRFVVVCSFGVIALYLLMFTMASRDRKRYEQASSEAAQETPM